MAFAAFTQARREPEGRARARGRFHADLAAHEFGQALGNGQTQACAAKAAGGGGVGLGKALEQPGDLLLGEPDAGVAHFEAQGRLAGILGEKPHPDAHLAGLGELDGVVGVVDQDLPQAQRIADEVLRHVRGHVKKQFQPLGLGFFPDQRGHVFEHSRQVEVGLFDGQLAGLNFREIQNIVDDAQQMLAGLLDLAHVVALAGGEFGGQRQVGQAHDGVHGGADFVAHVGQEIGLEQGGLHGGLLGRGQGPFHGFLLADVHEGADQAAGAAVGPAKPRNVVEGFVHGPVGKGDAHFPAHRAAGGDGLLVLTLVGQPVRLGQVVEVQDTLADKLLAPHAEGFLVGPVEPQKAGVRAFVEDGVGNGVEQHLLEGVLVGQGLLGPDALADIQGELEGQGQFGPGLVQVALVGLGQFAQQADLQRPHGRLPVAQGQQPDFRQPGRAAGQGDAGRFGQVAQGKGPARGDDVIDQGAAGFGDVVAGRPVAAEAGQDLGARVAAPDMDGGVGQGQKTDQLVQGQGRQPAGVEFVFKRRGKMRQPRLQAQLGFHPR